MMFTYTFTITSMMMQIIDVPDPDDDILVPLPVTKTINYDIESMKAAINAETRDGQAIDLTGYFQYTQINRPIINLIFPTYMPFARIACAVCEFKIVIGLYDYNLNL